eukprot:CAMPEP_0185037082 /NCGR_PEP_ID=MMETSP1103-20130426/30991_1 /TAXON_ID=36769 /ORGANISM="Paraphysomonas bandaiensis, Strain Caron Lab Isolate" /LENGTH=541 /DNA_ID=CAMNT_0027574891 /DNA_START=352 /DNA_END=1977 /DNA_ORIENTATION=+
MYQSCNHYPKRMKAYCSLIDWLGYVVTQVCLYLYLIQWSGMQSLVVVMIPLWLTSTITLLLKLMQIPPLHSRNAARRILSDLFGVLIHVTIRIILPMLVAFRVEGFISCPWEYIAIPLWCIAATAVTCAFVLLRCCSVIHIHAVSALRVMAIRLMVLCAVQLILGTASCMLSSIWLVKLLNHLYGMPGGVEVSLFLVFLPVEAMFLLLVFLYPLTLSYSSRYHALIYLSLERARESHLESQRSIGMDYVYTLHPLLTHSWLDKISDSLFQRTSPGCHGVGSEEELRALLTVSVNRKWSHYTCHDSDGLSVGDVGVSIADTLCEDMDTKQCDRPDRTCAWKLPVSQNDVADSRPRAHSGAKRLQVASSASPRTVGRDNDISNLYTTMAQLNALRQDVGTLIGGDMEDGNDIVSFASELEPCYICCVEPSDTCFMECGHGGLCFDCAAVIAKHPSRQCPICREEVSQILRITTLSAPMPNGRHLALSEEGYDIVKQPMFLRSASESRPSTGVPLSEGREGSHQPLHSDIEMQVPSSRDREEIL